jgi:UDP-N-acetylglucosamine acyltransferase
VIVNNVMIAGHVVVQDRVYFGGAAGIHQFARVGQLAMIGGQSHVSQDVAPFVIVDGKSNLICGLNLVGLRRAGFSNDEIRELKAAYRVIYRSGLTWNDTLEVLANTFQEGPAAEFHRFLVESKRGVVQERKTPRGATIQLPIVDLQADLRKAA